ncbi:MAG: 30S ribosomal protein S4 [Tissierellia bacterium]|nr:30S ribosomal protein S4 [Tissierellia bacterium]
MARDRGPILKRTRRLELEPQVVGVDKSSKRQSMQTTRKQSQYGMQLREKQKAKFIYGMQEKQFRLLFNRAEKMEGVAGENLLQLLELRFDNVVYRMGFAATRREARQLVVHGHFRVNGKKVDIPSQILKEGDVIEVKEKSKKSPKFKAMAETFAGVQNWLEVDRENLKGTIISLPTREYIDYPIEEHMITEFYSR